MFSYKKILSVGMALLLAGGLAACGKSGETSSTAASTAPAASSAKTESKEKSNASALTGSLTVAGSSAMAPIAKKGAERFMEKNAGVSIVVNAGGSGQGLSQVSEGAIDIGNSDLFAEEKLDAAKASELVDHMVCTTTMAAVINKDNPITSLTKQQMIDIFTGKITNWKDVGGEDLAIMLITRPESSGTRALFTQWALDGNAETKGSLETDDSGTLRQTVQENKGAIGYLALSYLKDAEGLKGVALDGVEPTLANTYNGTYPVWGFEHMYTKGEPKEPAKSFLEFMAGDEFGTEVEALGYGVMSKMDEAAVKSHTPAK
ncbi:MAG: phosphate ABC transporter substrate-binding protein [Peptoniphilaceae bacterium]|nr:phosphate ABC transporter substrate-binding protein [Peptoniphilaceae bacterium]